MRVSRNSMGGLKYRFPAEISIFSSKNKGRLTEINNRARFINFMNFEKFCFEKVRMIQVQKMNSLLYSKNKGMK